MHSFLASVKQVGSPHHRKHLLNAVNNRCTVTSFDCTLANPAHGAHFTSAHTSCAMSSCTDIRTPTPHHKYARCRCMHCLCPHRFNQGKHFNQRKHLVVPMGTLTHRVRASKDTWVGGDESTTSCNSSAKILNELLDLIQTQRMARI